MDWILDNLIILFLIAGGLASWLNSVRQAREEAKQDRQHDEQPADVDEIFGPDFDFGERSQKPGESPPQTEVFLPPPVTTSQSPSGPPPLPEQRQQPASAAAINQAREFPTGTPTPERPRSPHKKEITGDSHSRELERQRKLQERIRSLRHNRGKRSTGAAATQREVEAKRAARKGLMVEEVADPTSLGGIRSRLRSQRETRRAIVMREILGAPVGMR